eukprot:GHRR01025029.1.p2 GENE.GHRR01025029.1~~GHRR01025029.1.p2  ORF type:complete len:142 (-),score=26.34 GHRR01025029.1:204-629(-)
MNGASGSFITKLRSSFITRLVSGLPQPWLASHRRSSRSVRRPWATHVAMVSYRRMASCNLLSLLALCFGRPSTANSCGSSSSSSSAPDRPARLMARVSDVSKPASCKRATTCTHSTACTIWSATPVLTAAKTAPPSHQCCA